MIVSATYAGALINLSDKPEVRMKRSKIMLIVIAGIFSFSVCAAKATVISPKDSIQSTVDAVIEVLKDKELSAPDKKAERRSKISTLIKDRFNFVEMSKRSLARHWKERSLEEKKEFVGVFTDLLISSYVSKVDGYSDEKVVYGKETLKGKGKYGVVNTKIMTKKVDIPIDYKVKLSKGKWWVYDVVIEGVSFISTYRSQYNEIIVRESYTKLIKKMKTQLDEVN